MDRHGVTFREKYLWKLTRACAKEIDKGVCQIFWRAGKMKQKNCSELRTGRRKKDAKLSVSNCRGRTRQLFKRRGHGGNAPTFAVLPTSRRRGHRDRRIVFSVYVSPYFLISLSPYLHISLLPRSLHHEQRILDFLRNIDLTS
jgi:hypothetical protein